MTTLNIIPIPAFKDNYIWLITDSKNNFGIIVDPGEAEPVLKKLKALDVKLAAIFITHHHADHTGGIAEILNQHPVPVFGPKKELTNGVTQYVTEIDKIDIPELALTFEVLEIPGHTSGHIAYYGNGLLFCGDTLFSAGCGRLFEGTAEQMLTSLNKLANLPDTTLVYCGHEYTQANLHFAQTVEPDNLAIQQRIKNCEHLRNQNLPTVPSTLKEEKLTNPFLRCEETNVIIAAEKHANKKLHTPVEVFAAIREWKNIF